MNVCLRIDQYLILVVVSMALIAVAYVWGKRAGAMMKMENLEAIAEEYARRKI